MIDSLFWWVGFAVTVAAGAVGLIAGLIMVFGFLSARLPRWITAVTKLNPAAQQRKVDLWNECLQRHGGSTVGYDMREVVYRVERIMNKEEEPFDLAGWFARWGWYRVYAREVPKLAAIYRAIEAAEQEGID